MQTYLVGGAVRDRLLGRPVHDRDYVVVGTTPEAMRAAGFRPVGKDFPVFLHPQSHAEYALARTERKQGHGYHGFVFHAGPEVSLEEDLARRDLTINAMAEDDEGRLIDPFGGQRDLAARVLRHVSPAFVEDPLRILRVARFAARLAPLGFRVAAETMALMRRMVAAGEVAHLVAERVWQETRTALAEPRPAVYLRVLRECAALAVLFPELDALYGVPQPPQYHPEIDVGAHVELALDMAARLAPGDALIAWCTLTHDLGKALTPLAELPHHVGHEARGVAPVQALSARLKVPLEYRAMALLACRWHLHGHRALELKPATVLKLFDALDIWRRPSRLEVFIAVCSADARGRQGFADAPYPQAGFLRQAAQAARAISGRDFLDAGRSGQAVGAALRRARLAAVAAVRTRFMS